MRTRNGTGTRIRDGWTWLCDHCHWLATFGLPEVHDVDVVAVLHSIDATHYCIHKDGGAA
jgi:hypothetical protein